MYLKDANYIALRRARVARCWKESVMGRTRTSSPATVGDMQWVMCRTETALRLTSFAQGAIRLAYVMAYNERVALAASRMAEPTSLRQGFGWQAGLEPRKERNAAPARVSCELF